MGYYYDGLDPWEVVRQMQKDSKPQYRREAISDAFLDCYYGNLIGVLRAYGLDSLPDDFWEGA